MHGLWGAGVVDVAGGRGSLSFALQTVHGVNCTVVDPRPPKPTKEQLRFLQQPLSSIACSSDTGMFSAPRQSGGPVESSIACPESMANAPRQRTGRAEASAACLDDAHDASEQSWSRSEGASSARCPQDMLGALGQSLGTFMATSSAASSRNAPRALGQSLGRAVGRACLPEHIQAAFDEELWTGPHAEELHASSVITGLHPDQATFSPYTSV